jgi:hypothetical protein
MFAGISIIILAIIGVIVVGPVVAHTTQEEVTLTVTEKIVKRSNNNQDKYIIFTSEGEVLQNTDTIYLFKFNSSDVYGKIEVGKTYKFKVYGFRIQFLSMYRNIIDVPVEVKKKNKDTKKEKQ